MRARVDVAGRAFGPFDEAGRARRLAEARAAVGDGRYYAAFDGPRMVAAAGFHDMRQWWHGRGLRMAGVAGVKGAPEERGLAYLIPDDPVAWLTREPVVGLAGRQPRVLRGVGAAPGSPGRGFP